jgi:hypothetical protein
MRDKLAQFGIDAPNHRGDRQGCSRKRLSPAQRHGWHPRLARPLSRYAARRIY